LFTAASIGWLSLIGSLWLALLLRVGSGGGPVPRIGDEKPPDALEGASPPSSEGEEMPQARRLDYRDTSSHRKGPSAETARTRPMVRRENPAGETTLQRLARRAEEDRQEMRAGFAAILESIDSIRTEVRRGAQDSGRLEQRFKDLEWQVNLTRDEVQRRAKHPNPSQIASAKRAIRDTAKSPAGIVAAVCIFITTVSAAGGGIPKLVQGAERFWAFLAGREVAAISRPLVEPAKVPEK
jgi:hypothetical protein